MSLPGDDAKKRKKEDVTIKGTAGGLLIRLREDGADFEELLGELETRLQQGDKFFRNAQTSVELGKRELEAPELERLQEVLLRYEIKLESIVSGANPTRSAARQVGIPIRLPSLANTRAPGSAESDSAGIPFDSAEALLVRRTLRSGQVIRHHSDVCLIGDVNPGAEIIAGGSVLIWGLLRGTVHAGAVEEKASSSVICALHFSPAQIRIGDLLTRGPELKGQPDILQPVVAFVREGRIEMELWSRQKI